ncbi:MAG: MBL fold metallo-hydrolase [Treponemataceae bacterium]|nr:MBL fold metallo-hydrolase [Treponemataceae bacterium]
MENQDKVPTSLKMMFIGACGTVTGSCTLLRYTRGEKVRNILIDCGQVQNENFEGGSYQFLMNMAPKIDMIFLTHAHQDHIGLLPYLIDYGFNGTIWCTRATMQLTKVMLVDQMKIEKRDPDEIDAVIRLLKFGPVEDYKKDFHFGTTWCGISEGLQVGLLRSSHILGSCSYQFRWIFTDVPADKAQKEDWHYVTFSGDLGPVKENSSNSMLLKDLQAPFFGLANPYIIMESTYGSRAKESYDDIVETRCQILNDEINQCFYKGGTVLIPAFALNRSQELLLDLHYIEKKGNLSGFAEGYPEELTDEFRKNSEYSIRCSLETRALFKYDKSHKARVLKYLNSKGISKVDKDIKYIDLPQDVQDELLAMDREDYILKSRVRIASSLIRNVNQVYIENFFDSTMNKKGEIKYVYMPDMFAQKFGLDKKNFDLKKAKGMLKEEREKEDFDPASPKYRIVVASSGMCDKGKVLKIMKDILLNENNTVILTGYQVPGSNGYLLQNMADMTEDERYNSDLVLGTPEKPERMKLSTVKAKIVDMSKYYSGHADQTVLSEYAHGLNAKMQNWAPTKIFLTHGKDESRQALKEKIEELNSDPRCTDMEGKPMKHEVSVILPCVQQWYVLSDSSLNMTQTELQEDLENQALPMAEEEKQLSLELPLNKRVYGGNGNSANNSDRKTLLPSSSVNTENKKKFSVGPVDVYYPESFSPEQIGKIMIAIQSAIE